MTHITQEQAIELARGAELDWHAGYLLDDERDNRYHALCNAAIEHYIAQQAAKEPLTEEKMTQLINEHFYPDMRPDYWHYRSFARAIEAAHGIGGKV